MEPQSIKEVYGRPDRSQWEEAMKEEIEKLQKRDTWKVVPRPKNANIVGSKWVYRLKKDANGNVTSHRARLVAQGFTQIHGIDFDDTFAPIARMTSIRTVLALAARYDWEIHQVDVKSAYLYGELNEDEVIYTKPPPGDIKVCSDDEVLRLLKALYGLKQSG
jgi:integrase